MSNKLKLPTEHEIETVAKEETSFPKMAYPNSMIEQNCCSKFIQGANWAIDEIKKTNQTIDNSKLWQMAKVIVDKQKITLTAFSPKNINWKELEGDWFDWLEENLLVNDVAS